MSVLTFDLFPSLKISNKLIIFGAYYFQPFKTLWKHCSLFSSIYDFIIFPSVFIVFSVGSVARLRFENGADAGQNGDKFR